MANFGVDTKIENWLRQRGVQFEYREALRADELAPGWNLVNHGRHDGEPVDDKLIEKYASAMEQGAIFPAPVIAKTDTGFEVMDGCQRLSSAHLLGQSVFSAYIIKSSDPAVRASVRICANSVLNGTAPSQEWTIGKIVEVLYQQHKFKAVDCSVWSGQPVARIEEEIQSRESKRWMSANGVDVTIKPANQKGFQASFWRLTTPLVRDNGAKELKKTVAGLQGMKSNNSEAEEILGQVLNFKPKNHSSVSTQLKSKREEVFNRPEIRARMNEPRSQHPIDNVNRGLAGALTSMRATSKQHLHADQKQAATMVEMLTELKAIAKKVIPREFWANPDDVIE